MEKKINRYRIAEFLSITALGLFFLIVCVLSISSHFVTAQEVVWHIQPPDQIVFFADMPFLSAMMTVTALLAVMVVDWLLNKGKRIGLLQILCVLWVGIAFFWVWGTQLVPHADFEMLVESAKQFARNDFSIFFEHHYFHDYTYQLGFCLIMEIILRFFPFADLSLVMQMLNVVLIMAAAKVLGLLIEELTENKNVRRNSITLYLLFLPMIFFCSYVYGTVPMILMISCAYLSFVRFIKTGKHLWGRMSAFCIGVAVVFKPNAMVALIALCIAAFVQALRDRKLEGLLYALLGAVLAILLPKLIATFYEFRSGVQFSDDISMLARLAMGFQDARSGPGWYNNYTSFYSTTVISHEAAQQEHLNNLATRMHEFAQNPMVFVKFMRDKCFSMWLEPTYSTLWNGSLSVKNGPYNGMAIQLCREGMPLRALLEKYMDAFQQAMYLLTCIGTVDMLKKRRFPVQILLPVTVLGGFLYHALFEAKSQYIFVYAFFMMPIAAQGLCVLEEAIGKLYKKWRKAA